MIPLFHKPLLLCYLFAAWLPAKSPAVKSLHPLHVSTTEISYNTQDGKLEITGTIFTDDFEAALTKQYHTKTDLVKPAMHAEIDVLVKKYLADNLHIKTGAADAPLNYIGYEINREAVNVYLESDRVPLPKKIEASVSLLHNLYQDQLNIIHIIVGGIRKSGKLEYPAKVISQTF